MEKEESHLVPLNADLSVKYQKLATEYAKIRSQLNVLKKGIVDEQSKTAMLKDDLNEREKTIRKYEQEIDSYSFRNQQLEKRVAILQGDLTEKAKKGSKKGESKKNEADHQESSPHNSVPLNELLSKIDENVQLTRQISQQEDTFKKQLIDLTNMQDEKLASATTHFRGVINELQNEKSSLSRSLQIANEEVKAARRQICDFEEKDKNSILTAGEFMVSPGGAEPCRESSAKSSCDLINKLIKSQQETEYWKLEFELNKMKHSKSLLKYEECKKHLKALGREDLLVSTSEVTTPDSTFTTMFGKMEITSEEGDGEWGKTYETELIDYFTKRVNELINLLQLSDRKAFTFFDECKSLQAHLVLAVEERSRMQNSFDELRTKHTALSEELQLITNTYETQLQTLTEHIANMNDKLASQTDTIGHLESQLKQQLGSKKK